MELSFVPGTYLPPGLCSCSSFLLTCHLPSFSCYNPYLISLGCPTLMSPFLYNLVRCHLSSSSSAEHQWNIKRCILCSWFHTTLDNIWLGIFHTPLLRRDIWCILHPKQYLWNWNKCHAVAIHFIISSRHFFSFPFIPLLKFSQMI